MCDIQNLTKEYNSKLTIAENAVKTINSGDWVDYGWCIGAPLELDKALAERIKKENLRDLKFRGAVMLRAPEIFKIENAAEHFLLE